jgi:EmrB/QacA subfamily drug resistance transporter
VKKNPWLIIAVTSFGGGLAAIDAGIVNVALPTIMKSFSANIALAQWTISSYLLTACTLIPLFGRLSDMYSKRNIYLLGMVVFTLSSVMCGSATSMASLILFRAVQGVGAAMIFSNNQAIIVSNFPENMTGRALGVSSMLFAIGSILGPSLGGLLIQLFDWRSIFYINIPIGIIACYLGYRILPRDEITTKEPFDFLGAGLFITGLVLLLLVIGNSREWHWSILEVLAWSSLSLTLLIGFILWELFIVYPIVDLRLFKITPFASGNFAGFMVFMSFGANTLLLPICLQTFLGYLPESIGLFLFIPPILIMAFGPVSGYLADKIKKTILIEFGLFIITIGNCLAAFIPIVRAFWFIIFAQIILGLGFAFFHSPNNSNMLSSVPKSRLGIAGSLASLIRNIGKVIGVAFAVAIFDSINKYWLLTNHSAEASFVMGYKIALLITALLTFLAMIVTIKEFTYKRKTT